MPQTSRNGPDRERWRRLETICDAALRLDGPERAAYLESVCDGDGSLRAGIDDLLAHERRAARFLEATPGAVAALLISANASLAQAESQCVDRDPSDTGLVVTSDRSGSFDWWTMPSGGGTMAPITADPSAEWCADWSPDGKTLAFDAFRQGTRDIWTMPAAGGPWLQITNDPGSELHPSWYRDGRPLPRDARRSRSHQCGRH